MAPSGAPGRSGDRGALGLGRARQDEEEGGAAALCAHLLAGAALQTALTDTCTDCGEVMSDEFLAAMASFLADLGDRGVLLGAAS